MNVEVDHKHQFIKLTVGTHTIHLSAGATRVLIKQLKRAADVLEQGDPTK